MEINHEPGIIIDLNLKTDRMVFLVTNFVKPNDQRSSEEAGGFGPRKYKTQTWITLPRQTRFKTKFEREYF